MGKRSLWCSLMLGVGCGWPLLSRCIQNPVPVKGVGVRVSPLVLPHGWTAARGPVSSQPLRQFFGLVYHRVICYHEGMEMATVQFDPEHVLPIRTKLGLTQTELAERVGVSQPTVAMWEAGQRTPSGSATILLRKLQEQAETKSRKRS